MFPNIKISAPKWTARIPAASSMCGGLRIFTSSPYASCHQLSNGAEAIMAIPPQAARNAPSGARNPQIPTELARSSDRALRVVDRIRYPHEIPARMPHR